MNPSQGDVVDAFRTIVLGPFMAFAIGILFLMVARIYGLLKPAGMSGPFAEAYQFLGASLSISYGLFQLASSIGTLVAFAVIGFFFYNLFTGSGGTGRGGLGGR
ncbi:hypothetical protein [Haloarcula pellucida]|uniref:Uncharacterized protein n=1 Tax=Haloarcula pellucida TaxID=1427151 RepID=A0A830GL59_9EURY|nr:hypothetical protein [Halomicroarcula pellucida]MBX0347924.1 hypothetical protein [Halomicroarcula pellucida]GGN96088.1 hypothetical protein GCM10009030_23970 [Halomicroarcula pellucida]